MIDTKRLRIAEAGHHEVGRSGRRRSRVTTAEDGPSFNCRPKRGMRVVLLNREGVLTEDTPQEFAEANEFRFLPEDNVATNPLISFRVRSFAPTVDYNPAKLYQTRLMWRDLAGDSRSKLLLTKPEMVIAIVLRGETEPGASRKARPRRPAQSRAPRKRGGPRAEA
jgi:hypothetical protein